MKLAPPDPREPLVLLEREAILDQPALPDPLERLVLLDLPDSKVILDPLDPLVPRDQPALPDN